MKSIIGLIFVVVFSGCATLQSPKETSIAVSVLLDELQIAINEINLQTQGSSLPPFKNAEVVLSTKAGITKEGSAALVLTAEGKKSTIESNTLTLVLGPSNAQKANLGASTGKQLAEYVVAAVNAIDSKKFLQLQKLIVETAFDVTSDSAGGIKIDVASVSLGGKASSSSSKGHTLKLIFEKTEKSKQ